MGEEFRLAMEDMAREYNRQAAQLKQAYAELRELTAVGRSRDGMVTVTVGPRGQVRRIELNPRVYAKLSPSELADSIVEQVSAATGEVAERTKELMAPFVPEGLPLQEFFGEDASLEALLPQPIEVEARQ
ncbi:YbaB/EbfC family nucleoid-associated protein [Nonomuraea sp. LPB2021202275-12-8]|uniref:YbaB/EbfC family nucleoid-associated protein n=1 Tax=Nonomuraea sp. LPB2021202275-12-8 TaxID=3120159 RepID=UPI00300C3A91